MAEPPPANLSTDAQAAPGPVSAADSTFARLAFWQTVLSLVGVFIALVALYAALKESAAVRQQTAAAVWPYVQLMQDDFDTGETAGFALSFQNAGVGPARLRSLSVVISDQPMRDWMHIVSAVGAEPGSPVNRNFLRGRVLRPDEKVELIATHSPDLARRLQAAITAQGTYIRYCYCSIFDDCWLADSRRGTDEPGSVESCPDFGAEGYDRQAPPNTAESF